MGRYHLPPLTHCAKEVLKTLHKHSRTSVSNSQRVEVVPAPYGVQQSIESRRLFSHTAGSITASTALCRYSQRAHDTGTTIGGTQHEGNGNDCRPALSQPGIICDLSNRRATAATVGRYARQPE